MTMDPVASSSDGTTPARWRGQKGNSLLHRWRSCQSSLPRIVRMRRNERNERNGGYAGDGGDDGGGAAACGYVKYSKSLMSDVKDSMQAFFYLSL